MNTQTDLAVRQVGVLDDRTIALFQIRLHSPLPVPEQQQLT
jgi:hypothetical protein